MNSISPVAYLEPVIARMSAITATPLGKSLNVDLIEDVEAFAESRDKWNAIVSASGNSSLFLTHHWMESWWRSFGQNADVFCVLFSDEQGPLGLAAFCANQVRIGLLAVPALRLAGNDLSPRSDILLLRREREVWTHLIALLHERKWYVFDVGRLDAASPTIDLLQTTDRLHSVTLREEFALPMVDLSQPWAEWLATRSRTFRKSIRKAEEKTATMRALSFPTDYHGLGSLFSALKIVASDSWSHRQSTAISSDQPTWTFFQRLCEAHAASGELIATVLVDGDRPVAFAFGIRYGAVVYGLKTAYVESSATTSLGTSVMAAFIQACIADPHAQFLDMDGVDSGGAYKLRWADRIDRLQVYRAFRRSPLSKLIARAYRWHKRRNPLPPLPIE